MYKECENKINQLKTTTTTSRSLLGRLIMNLFHVRSRSASGMPDSFPKTINDYFLNLMGASLNSLCIKLITVQHLLIGILQLQIDDKNKRE